jgi:hypothetical protein
MAVNAGNTLKLVFRTAEGTVVLTGAMTCYAWSGILVGGAIKVKNELVRLRVFRVITIGYQFSIGMLFARAVTCLTACVSAHSGNVCAYVDGFRSLLHPGRMAVTFETALVTYVSAEIAFGGSHPGSKAGFSGGRLLLSENNIESQWQQGTG